MAITYLEDNSLEFPPSRLALSEPNGLLAVGGDLSVPRLVKAYQRGIFPWFAQGQPILWWTPDPRTIFFPDQVHCSRSMNRFIRRNPWLIRMDSHFAGVIEACSLNRQKSPGTWITNAMKMAYKNLHRAGYAHSIEVWDQEHLVGGLYGVALGRAFFGESMFSHRTNASKLALIVLCRFLQNHGFTLLDCQVASDHLFSLGARQITRVEFEKTLTNIADTQSIFSMQPTWQRVANKVISVDGHISH